MIREWSFFVLLSAIALGAVGCGRKSGIPRMTVYPVSGKITVAGQPVKGINVMLAPKTPLADTRRVLAAVVDADGNFRISTYEENDGAPAGNYALVVAVSTPMVIPGGPPPKETFTAATRAIVGKYSTTQSPAAEIVVKEGPNDLGTIDLK